jgi:hypothetical protein
VPGRESRRCFHVVPRPPMGAIDDVTDLDFLRDLSSRSNKGRRGVDRGDLSAVQKRKHFCTSSPTSTPRAACSAPASFTSVDICPGACRARARCLRSGCISFAAACRRADLGNGVPRARPPGRAVAATYRDRWQRVGGCATSCMPALESPSGARALRRSTTPAPTRHGRPSPPSFQGRAAHSATPSSPSASKVRHVPWRDYCVCA